MNNIDLNIDNYSFDDILNLFKIDKTFTKEDLKKCKEKVEKLHPSKSSLNIFPDLVRVQNISSNEYQYCAIEVARFDYGITTSSIQLSTPISSSYFNGGKINNITLLRLTPVADQLLCNFAKVLGNSGEGFILPNYPSPLFIKNFPEMVENFANKNLI